MNNLLVEITKKETITSLELLDQINIFRREENTRSELGHNDLTKIIRDEFEEEISLGKISQSNYTNDRGRTYPMYILSLSEAKQVLMRESKYVRKAVIRYIEELEKQISEYTKKDILLLNIVKSKNSTELSVNLQNYEENYVRPLELECQVKTQQIAEAKPKADYFDLILNSKDTMAVSQISKDYGMSAQKFNELLNELKIQYKQGKTWLLYQNYADKGYTQTSTEYYQNNNNETKFNVLTKWTQKGRLFLYNKLKEVGYIPLIEQ